MKTKIIENDDVFLYGDEKICNICGGVMHRFTKLDLDVKFSEEENTLIIVDEKENIHLVCYDCGNDIKVKDC